MRAAALALLAACASAPPRPAGPPLVLELPALGGGSIDLTEMRGVPTAVHVFTTWSAPATDDAARLRELDEGTESLQIVGVALDDGAVPGAVKAWRRATGVTYPIALATPAVRSGRSVLGPTRQVPFTLLYDARGKLLLRWDRALGDPGIAAIRGRAGLD